jgi:N-acetylglutamate synthase-like GNAT family acetyltransferase
MSHPVEHSRPHKTDVHVRLDCHKSRYVGIKPRTSTLLYTMTCCILSICLLLLIIEPANSFQPPSFGIASMLFPVRSKQIIGISTQDMADKRTSLADASYFFVDAFWTGKVGGGAKQLADRQRRQLEQSQLAEFNKRYGSSSRRKSSELLVCRDGALGPVVACAGVEVDTIPSGSLTGPVLTKAPLMSNLAVSRNYRRRGLAEDLVKSVEQLVQEEWGYDECFLYVEERNQGAVKLYQKLGYRKLWRDPYAETLLPTSTGDLSNSRTTIVCMRKELGSQSPFWSRLFP